ncbi:Nickel/cobalt efflux system (plasmid) [Cupriavidus necator]|uniref:HoxN/HupN/NixA family nickel/cobalt transporter n=1 Tax=Cupriavidus necator TaxID=106590 RepID=UPI003F73F2ED
MPNAAFDFFSLLAFALLLGIKHGFDADHLAMIDGMARLQTRYGRARLARYSGLLFSAGHGVVVLSAACLLQGFGTGGVPGWLNPLGAGLSVTFLCLIGVTNLRNAWNKPAATALLSPMAQWLLRMPLTCSLPGSLLVGALFALSFDTMSAAAWFGIVGSHHGGALAVFLLAAAFVSGMVATDALNGVAVAYLIGRSGRFAERATRLFYLVVACSALLAAGLGIAKFSSELVDAWAQGKELLFGLVIVALTLTSFLVARWLSRATLHST